MGNTVVRYPEEKENLWILTAAPVIWALHFLLSYITAAVWCAKLVGVDGSLMYVRLAIGGYTVVALIGIGITAWYGWQRHKTGTETAPYDFDSPLSRSRFLGFATLLLSGLSVIAVVYAALAVVFIESCH